MSGCTDRAGDFGEDELGLRDGPYSGEFWQWGSNFEANGAIEVHEDDDVDVPDCIIWDIDTGSVSRQIAPGFFVELLEVDDNELLTVDPSTGATGSASCFAQETVDGLDKSYQLVETGGNVALTVWQNFVFLGDVDVPPLGDPQLSNLLQNEVAFSFKHDHIYAGPWWDGVEVATTTANLQKANPMRRLLLGALVAGECGGDGLP